MTRGAPPSADAAWGDSDDESEDLGAPLLHQQDEEEEEEEEAAPAKFSLRAPARRPAAWRAAPAAPLARPAAAAAGDAGPESSGGPLTWVLTDLPTALLSLMLLKLDGPRDLARAACACRALRKAAAAGELAARWEFFYRRRWPAGQPSAGGVAGGTSGGTLSNAAVRPASVPAASASDGASSASASAPAGPGPSCCWQRRYVAREAEGRAWLAGRAMPDTFYGHTGAVRAVRLLPEGELVASAGADGSVRLWDLRSSTCVGAWARTGAGTLRALAADNCLLAAGGSDHSVVVWAAQPHLPHLFALAGPSARLVGHTGPVTCLSLAPRDECHAPHLLASGSWDQTVRLFAHSGQHGARWRRAATLACEDWVTGVAQRAGRVLVAAGAGVSVFDAGTGEQIARLTVGSPAGGWAEAGPAGDAGPAAAALGAAAAAAAAGIALPAAPAAAALPATVAAVDGTRCGSLLFTAGSDGLLRAMDLRAPARRGPAGRDSWGGGALIGQLNPTQSLHPAPLQCLAFDDSWLAAGSAAGSLALVDLRQLLAGTRTGAATGRALRGGISAAVGRAKLYPSSLGGRPVSVHAVDLVGSRVAVGTDGEGVFRVWDASSAIERGARAVAQRAARRERRAARQGGSGSGGGSGGSSGPLGQARDGGGPGLVPATRA